MTATACPNCGSIPGHRGSVAVRVAAGLRLGLWLLAVGWACLVCAGFFLFRFGNMAPDPDSGGVATTYLAYLTPLAVIFALDRCLVALADLLCPCRR